MGPVTRIASASSILALLAAAPAAFAGEVVVGLSPVGTPEEKMAEIQAVARHIIETVEPGEEAWVIDGLTQEQIAHYALRNDPKRYEIEQYRMRDNAAFFRDLKHFAESAIPPKEDIFAGKIDFPSTLRAINANYPATAARDLILYAASPVTHDPRHLDWSMLGGVIPDDDQLVASRADTIFGTAGEEQFLQNYTVHWGMNGTDWRVSDRHEFFMLRYASLSVTLRGGALATFATDPETALRNAKAGIAERVGPFTPDTDGRRTMVHFRPQVSAEAEEAGVSIYERRLANRIPSIDEVRAAQNVEIAIRWDCDCDFDLAVQVWGDDPISYRNPRSVSGTLFKDFTSTTALNNGWETVAMPGPVDFQALTIAVNQFSGASGAGEAELRIAIDGETWGRKLTFAGPADRGSGFERTMSRRAPANEAWSVARPLHVVGLE